MKKFTWSVPSTATIQSDFLNIAIDWSSNLPQNIAIGTSEVSWEERRAVGSIPIAHKEGICITYSCCYLVTLSIKIYVYLTGHSSQLNLDMISAFVCICLLLLWDSIWNTYRERNIEERQDRKYIFHQLIMLIKCQMKQTRSKYHTKVHCETNSLLWHFRFRSHHEWMHENDVDTSTWDEYVR